MVYHIIRINPMCLHCHRHGGRGLGRNPSAPQHYATNCRNGNSFCLSCICGDTPNNAMNHTTNDCRYYSWTQRTEHGIQNRRCHSHRCNHRETLHCRHANNGYEVPWLRCMKCGNDVFN